MGWMTECLPMLTFLSVLYGPRGTGVVDYIVSKGGGKREGRKEGARQANPKEFVGGACVGLRRFTPPFGPPRVEEPGLGRSKKSANRSQALSRTRVFRKEQKNVRNRMKYLLPSAPPLRLGESSERHV